MAQDPRTEENAQVHLAANMVAEPWFMEGGLIPQEHVQGSALSKKMVDEFAPRRQEQIDEVGVMSDGEVFGRTAEQNVDVYHGGRRWEDDSVGAWRANSGFHRGVHRRPCVSSDGGHDRSREAPFCPRPE